MRRLILTTVLTVLPMLGIAAPSPSPPETSTETCSGANIITSCEYGEVGLSVGAMLLDDGSSTTNAGASVINVDPDGRALPGIVWRCQYGSVELCTGDAAEGYAPITIADLASFTPAVGELIVQPENWGVLGIPTNFVATATDHVQQGTLLGQPIEVRWRPVAFTFDCGDGTVVTTTDAGAMWQTSDDDWTTTSTSHEYQERGGYTATVTITFEADIATGNGWATVPGQLDLAAPAEGVQVFEVRTVLTRGDCIDYPNDPGCSP